MKCCMFIISVQPVTWVQDSGSINQLYKHSTFILPESGGWSTETLRWDTRARKACPPEGHRWQEQLQQDDTGENQSEDGDQQREPRGTDRSHQWEVQGESKFILCAFLMLIIIKTGYTNVIILFLTLTGQEAGRSEEQIESMKDKTSVTFPKISLYFLTVSSLVLVDVIVFFSSCLYNVKRGYVCFSWCFLAGSWIHCFIVFFEVMVKKKKKVFLKKSLPFSRWPVSSQMVSYLCHTFGHFGTSFVTAYSSSTK